MNQNRDEQDNRPTLAEWKRANGERLRAEFSEAFGLQVHEWYDFAEDAYAKAHPPTLTGE